MLNVEYNGEISAIALSVLLIIYLIIVELGEEKIKKTLMPFIIVLILVFSIVAFMDIAETYRRIK